jgi:hypothetical protein
MKMAPVHRVERTPVIEFCECGHGRSGHLEDGECSWMGDGESGHLEFCGCERFVARAKWCPERMAVCPLVPECSGKCQGPDWQFGKVSRFA